MSVKKLHQYKGQHFGITRNSLHSARVQLICGNHEREDFLVNLIDESNFQWVSSRSDDANSDWAVGRESAGYPLEGDFEGAVEHAADLLLEECSAMRDIEDFFGDGGRLSATGKTVSYEGRQYIVTNMSSVAAHVDAVCNRHSHRPYIIGLVEHETAGWALGRPESGSGKYVHEGRFAEAVEHAANLLLRECMAMDELDAFFDEL